MQSFAKIRTALVSSTGDFTMFCKQAQGVARLLDRLASLVFFWFPSSLALSRSLQLHPRTPNFSVAPQQFCNP
jgi:hypothetical protein